MTEDSNQPFGHDTLELHAVIIPEGEEASSQNLIELLGHDSVRIPALLVPEGAPPPGYPYVHLGATNFGALSGGMSGSAGSSQDSQGTRGPEQRPAADGGNRPVASPPVPGMGQGSGGQVQAAIGVLQRTQDPGASWRARGAGVRAAQAAAMPATDRNDRAASGTPAGASNPTTPSREEGQAAGAKPNSTPAG